MTTPSETALQADQRPHERDELGLAGIFLVDLGLFFDERSDRLWAVHQLTRGSINSWKVDQGLANQILMETASRSN